MINGYIALFVIILFAGIAIILLYMEWREILKEECVSCKQRKKSVARTPENKPICYECLEKYTFGR